MWKHSDIACSQGRYARYFLLRNNAPVRLLMLVARTWQPSPVRRAVWYHLRQLPATLGGGGHCRSCHGPGHGLRRCRGVGYDAAIVPTGSSRRRALRMGCSTIRLVGHGRRQHATSSTWCSCGDTGAAGGQNLVATTSPNRRPSRRPFAGCARSRPRILGTPAGGNGRAPSDCARSHEGRARAGDAGQPEQGSVGGTGALPSDEGNAG